jgi:hypothetical protein
MKWWNSTFNAQGSRVIVVLVHLRAVKIYVAAVEALDMKLSLQPKSVEKLVWVPVILLCKIFIPMPRLMPCYVETGCSRPLIAGFYR